MGIAQYNNAEVYKYNSLISTHGFLKLLLHMKSACMHSPPGTYVTVFSKAMPIHNIDVKCHINRLESCNISLIGHFT